MATTSKKAKKAKTTRGYQLGFTSETQIVEPVPEEVNIKTLLRPARSLGCKDAEHWKELDVAMDAAISGSVTPAFEFSALSSFVTFLGYGVLQQLSQDALIRLCIQTRTDEMLRAWIEIKCDDEEKKEALERAIEEKNVRERLSQALTLMGLMGGSYLFIDTGWKDENLKDPLNKSSKSQELKVGKTLEFRVIDPIFTTPQSFNATNPLKGDFYKPSVFYVMSTPVHRSRLIRFVENELPDIMKPSYNFLGIPQAQLLSDYVTHFRKNREEVNRLLQKFSTSIVKGDLKKQLYNGAPTSVLTKRVNLFAKYRNNSGIALLDKDSEDFVQVNTPISGITDIVRQSLEFVVSVNQSGVVKTLGYSPAGFNATGESDIKLQADLISTRQEKILRRPIQEILDLLQLNLFGEIDPGLTFDFNPLDEDDERTTAEVEKLKADTAAIYLDRGVITEDELRETLRQDDKAPYGALEGEAPGAPDVPFADMFQTQELNENLTDTKSDTSNQA